MTYIDASAIIAILNQEPDWRRFKQAIEEEPEELLVSSLAIFEAAAGLAKARLGGAKRKNTPFELERAHAAVRAFTESLDVREIAITSEIGRLAIEAAAKYGKAVGHPAALNFGDCFAYACARFHHTSLLFKGDDFSKTDIAK
ncbi:MAG TPA: type II toxin-antitoxin system VapC family toxin [Methylocystis sp.]|nr:type II toxin-antitoxin system VapC family toxin [Methylocystis sp.]